MGGYGNFQQLQGMRSFDNKANLDNGNVFITE